MPDAQNLDTPPATSDGVTPPVVAGATPPADAAPKWEGDFDADRAARLVANLRDETKGYKSQLAEAQAKLSTFEQAQMSEAEKLASRASEAESKYTALLREKAVSDALRKHGLSDDDAEFLTGDTAEEIDAKAAKFAARSGSKPAGTDPLPPTLPIPGNGSDPAAVSQLTREQAEKLSPADLMAAYRAGRLRSIGGK